MNNLDKELEGIVQNIMLDVAKSIIFKKSKKGIKLTGAGRLLKDVAISQIKSLAKECTPTKTELIVYVRSDLIKKVQRLFNENIDQKFK